MHFILQLVKRMIPVARIGASVIANIHWSNIFIKISSNVVLLHDE